jgi:hypothetical protein
MFDRSAPSDGDSGAKEYKNSQEEWPRNSNYLSKTDFLTEFSNIDHTINSNPHGIHP